MAPTPTNLTLVALTLSAGAAAALAAWRLRATLAGRGGGPGRAQTGLTVLVAAGTLGLLVYRWATLTSWNPLHAHVDGLLLISALLGGVGLYLETRPRLRGLVAFVLPLLTLLLAWAVCASAWTYRPFKLESLQPVWRSVHLAGVYLGTLSAGLAAVAGAAYLVFAGRLKRKRDPRALGRVASLEAVEGVIVRAATLGFTLLTLGLVSGVVILREDPGALSWASPKVLLAAASWATYAVVMNVRYAAAFRGRRAAWLAIGGFALLLGVYGVVTAGGAEASG